MQLYTIDTGFFKLDGGAMFGVVPRVLWSKTNPPDENNLCPWAMRSLLIEDGNKLILIDNGIGDKQDDKFLRHYYLHGDVNLQSSLAKNGFSAVFYEIVFNEKTEFPIAITTGTKVLPEIYPFDDFVSKNPLGNR